MPGPIHTKSGVFYLNVRVPRDLLTKVKGTRIVLPRGEQMVAVRPSDKVIMSLLTRDPGQARERFTVALAALTRHWKALRDGPIALPHKQIVALAGEIYRARVANAERDLTLDPDYLEAKVKEWVDLIKDIRANSHPDDLDGLPSVAEAKDYVVLDLAHGDTRHAEQFYTLHENNREGLLDYRYGDEATEVLARHGLHVDDATRRRLLERVDEAAEAAGEATVRQLEGDFSPHPAGARFPSFEPLPTKASPAQAPTKKSSIETVAQLFERYKTYHADKRADSTVRRYASALASLDRFAAGRDWRLLTDDDIYNWAEHRTKVEGVSARTVNKNDLVAVSSVLGWPTSRGGGKLTTYNAAAGVKLDEPRKKVVREKTFRQAEIKAILTLARSVQIDPKHPRASASRRWCAWICAYSGARVQETLWMTAADVFQESRIWVMRFPETKTAQMRLVPIHKALIAEGFLDFARNAPSGYLFCADTPPKLDASRTQQELRASELSSWIRSKVVLDPDLNPMHAWRHTWITLAEAARIPKRFSNRITGHNQDEDASDGYVGGALELLADEMDRFPTYDLN